jgi:hypothetical protein
VNPFTQKVVTWPIDLSSHTLSGEPGRMAKPTEASVGVSYRAR